ncbi:MAG: hypothetical protein U9Q78_02710 [Chloroflexota bacterium]|nr:hypothetical protein [Chloroflexota bacterium]
MRGAGLLTHIVEGAGISEEEAERVLEVLVEDRSDRPLVSQQGGALALGILAIIVKVFFGP